MPAKHFKEFLRRHAMCAPSTYPEIAEDPMAPTFTGGGASRTLDFVVVPLKLLRKTRGAKVETSIAEDHENEDHKPAGLTVILGASGKDTWWKRRDVCYDREKLASKEVLDLI